MHCYRVGKTGTFQNGGDHSDFGLFDFQGCEKGSVGQSKLETGITYKGTIEGSHAKNYHSRYYNKKVAA